MSQPRQTAPPSTSSPSISKSSLRRTSGPQNQNPNPTSNPNPNPSIVTSARGLPQPHFEDDPIVASYQSPYSPRLTNVDFEHEQEQEHAIESEQYGLGQDDGQSITIPSFQPFFTLIEDSVTSEHYHPTVHYVFADDDSEIIAEAACRSLQALDPSQRPTSQTQIQPRVRALSHQEQEAEGEEDDENDAHHPRLPPPIAGVCEHYLILEVQPRTQPLPEIQSQSHSHSHSHSHDESVPPLGSAYEVTSAQSLSADWQVLRSTITTAPTIGDGGGSGAAGEDDGLMLRIQGRGNMPGDAGPGGVKESMEEMIERFQRRLEDIRQVMEATATATAATTVTTIRGASATVTATATGTGAGAMGEE
ncbi:hypothetical protein A1O3_08602 [Capronia epimyces CBS 606.96]|uniref:Anaphase-promoting complex subunit 11 RING-H2 finger domain-containing protein n=1 Tax=Capronia epimyces CBS 606.96 TaxID=1182542 RepID=W9XQ41_9EURO|nr:uncharacterized protein A1O3_08602 [Capronia epimyces CBS 606.96]EXJ79101.1 hypothetical protein A1O3_08602 [Capronia epimyces CBS 606.96]